MLGLSLIESLWVACCVVAYIFAFTSVVYELFFGSYWLSCMLSLDLGWVVLFGFMLWVSWCLLVYS